MNENQLVSTLHGVGPALEKRLKALGVVTLHDLVYSFPREYEDLSEVTDVIDIADGDKVTVLVTIEKIQSRRAWKRRMNLTEAQVGDATGSVKVVWFNQPYVANTLAIGDKAYLSGIAKKSKYGLALQSPVFEKAGAWETTHTARIVPKYHLTQGVTQKQLRYFMKQALGKVLPVKDWLPESVVKEWRLMPLSTALQQIHFPDDGESFTTAQKRLDFEQLYIVQLFSRLQQEEMKKLTADAQQFHEDEVKAFVDRLPFTLTDAQRKAAWTILKDLQAGEPMNRLLIGDVGSGKTVVAAIAMLNTVRDGKQAVLMAPTEILAKQHAASLKQLFGNLSGRCSERGLQIELLTASTKPASTRNAVNASTGQGGQQAALLEPDIIVGTHALIQEHVSFERLGLAVVDEQHRFGVAQRKALKDRSGDAATMPHLLSMTATPIPRSLALALYGELSLSLMKEMPKGRKPIMTRLVPPEKRKDAYGFIQEHIEQGEQCFVICPLIDPSDKLGVKSVSAEYERLSQEVFPDLSVAMLHGKMKPEEKDATMQQMKEKKIDILVSTSVIEVGVDIPDATVMVIEGAERFGLAQLHQFRGRVGRSDTQSYCLLFASTSAEQSLQRLKALTTTNDGFKLAELDLEMRGAGEVFGTLQSGFSETAVIAFQHPTLLQDARNAAEFTINQGLIDGSPGLQEELNAFIRRIHLE